MPRRDRAGLLALAALAITIAASACGATTSAPRTPTAPDATAVEAPSDVATGTPPTTAARSSAAAPNDPTAPAPAPSETAPTGGTTTAAPTTVIDIAAGRAIFDGDSGCAGCHTLKDAGATAEVGPNLDRGLAGKSAKFIRQSIVDPNAVITPGFPANLMPGNFGTELTSDQIAALVAYLVAVTR